jgi:hypothetical protein
MWAWTRGAGDRREAGAPSLRRSTRSDRPSGALAIDFEITARRHPAVGRPDRSPAPPVGRPAGTPWAGPVRPVPSDPDLAGGNSSRGDISRRRGPGVGGKGPPRQTLKTPFIRGCPSAPSDPFPPSGDSRLVRTIPLLSLLGATATAWLLAVARLHARIHLDGREALRDSFDGAGACASSSEWRGWLGFAEHRGPRPPARGQMCARSRDCHPGDAAERLPFWQGELA